MMKRAITILPPLCALLVFGACAAKRHVRVAPLFADDPYWTQVAPKEESTVLVTEGDLQRNYSPIARIFVDSVGWDKNLSFT